LDGGENQNDKENAMSEQDQRVAVVTGASSGIGKAAARQFVEAGWQVIGVGRDAVRCAEAAREISGPQSRGTFQVLRADFATMADVQRVAREITELTDQMHVLINNAGGVRDRKIITPDGAEATFAANHLAPFLLTRELLPLLVRAAEASPPETVRVIAVSSSAHRATAGLDFGDLQSLDNFVAVPAYCRAKLANILFTRELGRRLASRGIVAQAMHPGVVGSNFASHGDDAMQRYMASAVTVLPEVPAETLLWMATSPEAGTPSGRYFYAKAEEAPAHNALDDDAAKRLWVETESLLASYGFGGTRSM
jgi:NAD(P)-dependent dehydrogenase (short-subunit alcohol dehydrogenase family)